MGSAPGRWDQDPAGRCSRPRKRLLPGPGANAIGVSQDAKWGAVVASENLQVTYPKIVGFSSRNLRRMREFYCTYKNDVSE